MDTAVLYQVPDHWIKYEKDAIFEDLSNAKAAVLTLKAIPFQKRWVEALQKMQLKMEVAGTSQIEGADFAGNELESAMRAETAEELHTRSQKQASGVLKAYRWIATVPDDMPVDGALMKTIHAMVVTDCDDDHCAPGQLRRDLQNVTFGVPKHRGARGGDECELAFQQLADEVQRQYRHHDPLIQALALHYHFGALHPFQDGNGRTARVLEALMLQRAGLKNSLFIAMSNYYYEEKRTYLQALADVRAQGSNLTTFIKFGLKGIALQATRLLNMIRHEVSKQLFRNLTHELFARLQSTRKRVIVKRQLVLLEQLLDVEMVEWTDLIESNIGNYASRRIPIQALVRDVNKLSALGAITVRRDEPTPKKFIFFISVNLDWPSTITETEFFTRIEQLPKSKTSGFLLPA